MKRWFEILEDEKQLEILKNTSNNKLSVIYLTKVSEQNKKLIIKYL
jgi:hypothetical protein